MKDKRPKGGGGLRKRLGKHSRDVGHALKVARRRSVHQMRQEKWAQRLEALSAEGAAGARHVDVDDACLRRVGRCFSQQQRVVLCQLPLVLRRVGIPGP